MSVNINFRVIFLAFWSFNFIGISCLWTFCSISLQHNLSLCILWCLLPKTAVHSFSFRQLGPQWLFQWTYLVIITCFVSTDHQRHATSTHTPIVFISSGPLSGRPVPFSLVTYITMVTGESSLLLSFMKG